MGIKFNPKKLKKLNNPDRLKDVPPEWVWEKLQLKSSDVLIDIGAGTGFYSIPFLKLSDGGIVYACDISETMINWMNENICTQHPGIKPIQMEECTVDLSDSVADLVVMINLHHELKAPLELLTECLRLLKSGGKIVIIDWKKEDMPQGPPTDIRCDTETVINQLDKVTFNQIKTYDDLEKHFVIIGEK